MLIQLESLGFWLSPPHNAVMCTSVMHVCCGPRNLVLWASD